MSVTKTEVYTILRDVCIVSNRLTYMRWKYWRNRCARHCSHSTWQCLPPPLFVTQKSCRSEFQNPPIKSFTSKIDKALINTLQLATRKNVIQMSPDVITLVTVIINYWLLQYVHFRAMLLLKWRKTWERRMVLFETSTFWGILQKFPDFQGTCLDYFVFPYLKNNVFKNRPSTFPELMQVITYWITAI
jgi:hypothetical protein